MLLGLLAVVVPSAFLGPIASGVWIGDNVVEKGVGNVGSIDRGWFIVTSSANSLEGFLYKILNRCLTRTECKEESREGGSVSVGARRPEWGSSLYIKRGVVHNQ